jgi:mono/diheme cytochrome c family protein
MTAQARRAVKKAVSRFQFEILRLSVGVLGFAAAGLAARAAPPPVLDPAKLPPAATRAVEFSRDIEPILESSCLKCHGPEKSKSGFRLDSREKALAGGDNGTDIFPGDSAKSPLVHFAARLVADFEMPPEGKGDHLTVEQVGLFRAWIDQGAKWPATQHTAGQSADKMDWWSFKPIAKPAIPEPKASTAIIRNPIDSFVVAKLGQKGLVQSPEATRAQLIRRLAFDLAGLPPTPEEVEAFVRDPDPRAYERLVDRLLASPHYGERWARHWLDVVHYGETHGYDKDKPRPNAWPYRDYVIRSLNEDKPYTRFVEEQVAGDILFPETRDGIEALGFVAAGPWDFIGHAEVAETKIDGKVARHLDRDDMVANTIQTFNSLTVQCAQCHNHKFDPIPQEDYYSLQADFAALDRADKKYDIDPAVGKKRADLKKRREDAESKLSAIIVAIKTRAGQELTDLDVKLAALEKSAKSGDAFGYHSQIEAKDEAVKWVEVDLGRSVALSNIVLHPCKDDFNNIGAGFGFPARFKVEISEEADFKSAVQTVGDRTGADTANPGLTAQVFAATGKSARYIRVTATKLAPRQGDYLFALSELEAFGLEGTNTALGAPVTALDSIEAPARWRKSNLTDGYYPGIGAEGSVEVAALRTARAGLLARVTRDEEQSAKDVLAAELASAKEEEAKLPPPSVAYVATVYYGSGAFLGTGPTGGHPRPVYILNRGNVQKPGKEASPGALTLVNALPSRFELRPEGAEGDRRAALAKWLADKNNPLTWRSIVNRVWEYHFGKGIVDSPNDFGHMGALPSHPDLLDWLASNFRDSGGSLKVLHRLIVTSATYRQSSLGDAAFAKIDSDNRFLWRMNRRKLEAEEVRDSILFVSGKLDTSMGGPSFQDFVVEKPEHSPHYEYALHDPDDPKSFRRSIYRFIVRSQPNPFMVALDCADPSIQMAKRNDGISPLQALAMLNDSLMAVMAKHFAEKIGRHEGTLPDEVDRAFYETMGHPPSPRDRDALANFARENGLPNLCRLLMNLNEFVFVD